MTDETQPCGCCALGPCPAHRPLELTEDERAALRSDILRKAMSDAHAKVVELDPAYKEAHLIAVLAVCSPHPEFEEMGIPAARLDPLCIMSDAHPILLTAIFLHCFKMMMAAGPADRVPDLQRH